MYIIGLMHLFSIFSTFVMILPSAIFFLTIMTRIVDDDVVLLMTHDGGRLTKGGLQ